MKVLLALALVHGVTLHAGQVRFYAPDQIRAGERVVCVASSGRISAVVPAHAVDTWSWTKSGAKLSLQVSPNGGVELACDAELAPVRFPDVPYVLGRNGLGLLRGTNRLAGVRKLFGGAAVRKAGVCRLSSSALGFAATFNGSCAPGSLLVAATVTGARWSTLDGVEIGDSVARMRWQDAPARRFSPGVWLLGGEGKKHPPRLLAVIRDGRVAAFEIRTR